MRSGRRDRVGGLAFFNGFNGFNGFNRFDGVFQQWLAGLHTGGGGGVVQDRPHHFGLEETKRRATETSTGHDAAVRVDEEVRGEAADAERLVRPANRVLAGLVHDGVRDAGLFDVRGRLLGRLDRRMHAEHREPLAAVPLVQLDDLRHLRPTWAAVGEEEVDQHPPAAKVFPRQWGGSLARRALGGLAFGVPPHAPDQRRRRATMQRLPVGGLLPGPLACLLCSPGRRPLAVGLTLPEPCERLQPVGRCQLQRDLAPGRGLGCDHEVGGVGLVRVEGNHIELHERLPVGILWRSIRQREREPPCFVGDGGLGLVEEPRLSTQSHNDAGGRPPLRVEHPPRDRRQQATDEVRKQGLALGANRRASPLGLEHEAARRVARGRDIHGMHAQRHLHRESALGVGLGEARVLLVGQEATKRGPRLV